jgi:hypothetical protein
MAKPFALFNPRRLSAAEIAHLEPIFRQQLRYERVRICEDVSLPDAIDNFGRWIKKMNPRAEGVHNAITLGNRCLFGGSLPAWEAPSGRGLAWLVHELVHVCQFQHLGWKYLRMAWRAQRALGGRVYDFGGEGGLRDSFAAGKPYRDFNLEQQAHIVETYYLRTRLGKDISAWEPYMAQFRDVYPGGA